MIQQQYPSQLLEKAVAEFSKLPGIGRKTALRLVLWMLRQDESDVEQFAEAVSQLKREVKYCHTCHNISDTDTCPICSDMRRDATTVCVVESVQDVMAIENTQQYHGRYHVLGGIISQMDGIGCVRSPAESPSPGFCLEESSHARVPNYSNCPAHCISAQQGKKRR